MRRVGIGSVLLASMMLSGGMGGVGFGQIAAPSLVPGTFSSENPAAIKWGAPSRFGGAIAAMQEEDQPADKTTDFAGGAAGLRLVGELLALGIEGQHMEDQRKNLHDVRDAYSAALALQTGSALAWGLGYNAFKQTRDTVKSESSEPDFGLSLRLAEVWFIGGTVGRESVTSKDELDPTSKFNADRDVVRAGVGFRRGGTVLVHIEAFVISKQPFETDTFGKVDGEETAGGTMEFTFWSFLLGGSARHTKVKYADIDTMDLTTADIGYAPREGFALTLHYESAKTTYKQQATDPEQPTRKSELGAVVFTYQF